MDTCVPNANFSPSHLSFSIYEQDRQNLYCQKVNYNMDVHSDLPAAEENGLLDDTFEDSKINFLNPGLLNSMASSSSAAAPAIMITDLLNAKALVEDSSSYDPGADVPFNQFGMDEMFSIFNMDSNDSKFSFPDFDCMPSNPPSSCHTPVPTSEARPDYVEFEDRIGFISRNRDITSSTTNGDIIGQKFGTMKHSFPPRKSEPPVGVVAPVINVEEDKKYFDHHPIKMEVKDKMSFSVDKVDTSPQTVPSFTVSSQNSECSPVKIEPVSSEFTSKKDCLKRSSTEDKYEDWKQPKRRRCDSGSSGITSEDGDCDDNDNYYDSDDDNSDLDADLAHMKPGGCESLIGGGKKQKQYFWQYNVQAKGPKGTRLKLAVESPADPHILNGFEDPVFDEGNTTVAGIRHGGKARKGDGNEVSPNPHKLFKIGHQLLRLNKKINGCQLGSDVPLAQRNEARKEKNKLASRACRLKKKAQHEANKIKLNGLEMEHGQINNVLRLLWPELRERAKCLQNEHHVEEKPLQDSLFNKLNGYITSNMKSMVAGHTTDYVNNVIMNVEKGDLTGGLKGKARKT